MPSRRPLRLAIGLLSGAAISYQVLLIRAFSIAQWHHFAFMVISLALLGYGASGSYLALRRRRLLASFGPSLTLQAGLFGPSAVLCYVAAQRVPFNPLEVVWDPRQLMLVGAVYLLLALPFFFVANAIGLCLIRFGAEAHLFYRADLLGAGLGALTLLAALWRLPVASCMGLIGSCGLLGAAVAAATQGSRAARAVAAILALAAVAGPSLWPRSWLEPVVSPYKALSRTLLVPGARKVAERSSPLELLSVVDSPRIPFRYAPGLSFEFDGEPPEQLGLFRDGDSMTAVDRGGPGADHAYLDYLPSALPHHLLEAPAVAILGVGGGELVRTALAAGAREVHLAEADPELLDLLQDELRRYAGGLLDDPRVRIHPTQPRGFLARPGPSLDLVRISLLAASGAGSGAGRSFQENQLLTVEAFVEALRRLRPGGMLVVDSWIGAPPREGLKLTAMTRAAVDRMGGDATSQVALVRSWNTLQLLVAASPWTGERLERMRQFCDARSFELIWPAAPAEAESGHLAGNDELASGAAALLGADKDAYLGRYKFDLRPPTDDRPYFNSFFRWRFLPEFLRLRERGGAFLLEWGYLVLTGTLAQALVWGLALILLPLVLARRRAAAGSDVGVATPVYFLSLGLAFLFLEIAFIQRFTLFLDHPTLSVAIVLAGFLVFAGLGSGLSQRALGVVASRGSGGSREVISIWPVAAGIFVLALVYVPLLPAVFRAASGLASTWKALVSLILIAPLAFLMGMPFPAGLERLAREQQQRIPWAWGFNGWASVVGAVLATTLAIHWGFRLVVVAACALYGVAAAAFGGLVVRQE